MTTKSDPPFILGIGGTATPGSSTERALTLAMASVQELGARIRIFGSETLVKLPHYLTEEAQRSPQGADLIAQIRAADGLIIASPGYHGSVSGLLKNALDYAEETARDERPYISGLPVGVIATAYGWQGAVSTMSALRSIVHALRGFPTPFGAAINTVDAPFKDGQCSDDTVRNQLQLLGKQVYQFVNICRA